MIEIIGLIAGVLAVIGVLCNNRKMSICFYIWLVSNSLSAGLHFHAGLISLAIRDLVFLLLAIEGIVHWRSLSDVNKKGW